MLAILGLVRGDGRGRLQRAVATGASGVIASGRYWTRGVVGGLGGISRRRLGAALA